MNFTRTQIETDLQCKLEFLGRLDARDGYNGIELHRHPFFELFYISNGSFTVLFENDVQRVSRGDLILISPNVLHRFESDPSGEMLYVGISLSNSGNVRCPDCMRLSNADVCETMSRICYGAAKKGASVLRAHLTELLPKLTALIFSVMPPDDGDTSDALSEKVKGYLRQHLGENVTVKEIAGALYMNSHYLGEYFKKKNGITINNYLLSLRMQKAFVMLREGSMSVSQIAEAVGFDTVQYFSTRFKAYYGISPAKYIDKLKGNMK